MKKLILFAVVATGFALSAGTASAWCYHGCENTGYFNYGAGGQAVNEGHAVGDLTGAWSATTKDVYGGGDARAHAPGMRARANAYAGSHFTTSGGSVALSAGPGASFAGTSEMGQVQGGGNAIAGTMWVPNP